MTHILFITAWAWPDFAIHVPLAGCVCLDPSESNLDVRVRGSPHRLRVIGSQQTSQMGQYWLGLFLWSLDIIGSPHVWGHDLRSEETRQSLDIDQCLLPARVSLSISPPSDISAVLRVMLLRWARVVVNWMKRSLVRTPIIVTSLPSRWNSLLHKC